MNSLKSLGQAFKVPEIRKKIIFTVLMLIKMCIRDRGKPALGLKTRKKNKASDKYIVKRRNDK